MKIIQVTDLHLVEPGAVLCGLDPLARLQACITDINENHGDAELVIFTGDLSDTGDEVTYRVLADGLTRLIPPFRLMLGNHDDRDAFLSVFNTVRVEEGFVQSVEDTREGRLILLDTLVHGRPEGRLDEVRLRWLHQRPGHAHRPIAGSWRGIPVSVLRGTNHQSALDFSPDRIAVTHEPPAYAVIFIDRDSVIAHFHDFLDRSAAYR